MSPTTTDPHAGWADEEQLLRAAWYYYVDQLTQDETAKRLSISRASAGRLLDRCRKSGIVTFTISAEHYDAFALARRLKEKYGLREALVPPDLDDDTLRQAAINRRLALSGAQYLNAHLKVDDVVGVGWGETVRKIVAVTNPDVLGRVSLVTLTGGVGGYVDTLRQVRRGREDAPAHTVLPTPIAASTPELAAALRAEPSVQDVLDTARRADVALVGIGAVATNSTLSQLGYASAEELDTYARAGAVGDILGVFFDADGQVVDVPLHGRRIGIDLEDLRRIPHVVSVAGGIDKVAAIRAALRGNLVDVLVTSENVARALLEGDDGA